jgi:hypothetical protein
LELCAVGHLEDQAIEIGEHTCVLVRQDTLDSLGEMVW